MTRSTKDNSHQQSDAADDCCAAHHSVVPRELRAWRCKRAITIAVTLFILGLAGDLLSKHYVFSWLLGERTNLQAEVRQTRQTVRINQGRELTSREMLHALHVSKPVMPGVSFTLSVNKGAVFGLEMHKSQNIHRLIVGIASLATVALVFYFFATSHRNAWPTHVSMAFILAGALGNLYDRLFSLVELPGMDPIRYNVRDFIDCSEVPLPFGVSYAWIFNVADVLLVVGVAILAIQWLVHLLKHLRTGKVATAAK